jgi:hypothetical protein
MSMMIYVFLSMSKSVSVAQGLTHSSHVLEREHLWELVNKAWEHLPLDSLARAYVQHHQVASAIHDCQGGDEFAAQQQGLHFNVCKLCVPYFAKEDDEEPAGVEVLEEEMDQMDSSKLQFKYQQPNVMGESMGILSREELEFLYDNLDEEEDEDERLEVLAGILEQQQQQQQQQAE